MKPEGLGQNCQQLLSGTDGPRVGAAVALSNREVAIEQRDATSFWERARGHQAIAEMGARMGAREPVRDRPIDGRHLLARELADVVPLVAIADLVKPQVPFA